MENIEESNQNPLELVRKLAQKKANVMKAVERVPKNGYNSFHKYHYTTESDLIESLRPLLIENLLGFSCEILESADKPNDVVEIVMNMTLTDLETGFTETKKWKAEGQDKGDKSFYKASTGAVKYYLMKTFLVPTGDDPELTEDNTKSTGYSNQNQNKSQNRNQDKKNEIASAKQIGAIKGKIAELMKLGKTENDILIIIQTKCGQFEKVENMPKTVANKAIDYLQKWIDNAKTAVTQ